MHDEQPPLKKVAIIGGAESRARAPYGDHSWDIWAFSSLKLHTPRITRWFEMHALGDLKSQLRRETRQKMSYLKYMQFLKQLDCPVYMQQVHEDMPNSVRYPIEDALNAFGRCFTSTVSYLIALAMLEGYDTIGVWGVHLVVGRAYTRQRPAVEYLLGVAQQRGINVYLPAGCPLRVPAKPVFPSTDILYGYDWQSPKAWWRRPPTQKRRSPRIPGLR